MSPSTGSLSLSRGPSYTGAAPGRRPSTSDALSHITLRVDLESGRSVYVTLPVGPGPIRGPIRLSTPDAGLLRRLRAGQAGLKEALSGGPRGLDLVVEGLKPARQAG